ncbi:MAG: ABC transporter ATP-binding protein [Eubacterium sp.]|nr:ABC transporter ATP-binding protein [Eubacterium sp.]
MKKHNNEKNQIKHLLFAHSKRWLIIAIMSMVILSVYNLVISWLLQKIIDIAAGSDPTSLSFIVIVAVITFIIFMAAYFVFRTARPKFIQTAMEPYKAGIFSKILGKKIGSLSNENTGKLISALTNDMRSVEDYYLDSILTVVDIGVSFIGALILMIWYSPVLTLAAVLLSVLPIIVSLPPAKKLAEAEKKVSDGNAGYVEIIKDILSGFPVIKSFRAEKEIQKRFEIDNSKIEGVKYARRYTEENVNLLSTAASVIMRLGVFVIGAWMAVSGTGVTPGIVLVFLQLVTFVISPIERMPALLANRKAAITIMDKLSDFLFEHEEASGKEIPHTLAHGIVIRDLSFRYEDDKETLHGINLDFMPGKKYAIVGGSGSGKTTLLNLIMQTYDNYEGSIMFDSTELRHIHPDSLFQTVSLVGQSVFVFNDTVYNNVTLYKNFPDSDVQSAINKAGLSEFITAHGNDYICGENGNALSGGEKQRISIARALLRNTSVLLMDEATAALDGITANSIMNSVLAMEDITRIIVTHRLDESVLREYDEIIVLRRGEVAEQGTFDDLIEKHGLFYSLFTVSQ